MQLSAQQLKAFDDQGYVFLPELLRRRRSRADALGGRGHPQGRPPGGLAREDRRAAHRVRRAHLQRAVPAAGQPSAAGRAAEAVFRRGRLRPPVQAQRQGRVRGRGLAVAPGLRHLGARRRHAGGPRHEHRGVPRRGDADQRPAAAGARQPQAGRAGGRPRQAHHVLSALDARQGDGDAGWSPTPKPSTARASWRRPASPARC